MKARVKATGEIIELCNMEFDEDGNEYYREELDFIDDYESDYREKLKHQYAGMAMQGILNNDKILGILGMQKGKELDDMISDMSVKIATTLVNRLNEQLQCKEK